MGWTPKYRKLRDAVRAQYTAETGCDDFRAPEFRLWLDDTFPQGDPWSVAVLCDEHHASGFKGGTDGGERAFASCISACFIVGNGVAMNTGFLCQVCKRPI